jgi:hypothetical protein
MKKPVVCVLPLVLAGSVACKKSEAPATPPPATAPVTTAPAPVTVTGVTLGNAVGADKRVTTPSDSFSPRDTIYASVETTGAGRAPLRALWTFVRAGQTSKVDETTIEIDAVAPTVTEFHVSKPSGWPKGDYRVEIFVGEAGSPAMTKTFKVV